MSASESVQVAMAYPVATVILNRPQALNAITREMLVELNDALDTVTTDPQVRVMVLTGAGRAFSAGVALKALGQRALPGGAVGDTARTFTGAEAAEWGLAVRAVPLAELDAAVDAIARAVASNSAGAIAAQKDLCRHAL